MSKKRATKSTQKKSNIWDKLTPRTRKSQFIVFLLVFALIGGGVMAYRSFAASSAIVYTPDKFALTGKAHIGRASETKMKGSRVAVLSHNGKASIGTRHEAVVWAPYVRVCANIHLKSRGNSIPSALIAVTIQGQAAKFQSTPLPVTSQFIKYCSPYFRHIDAREKIGGYVQNQGALDGFEVSSMSIEYTN